MTTQAEDEIANYFKLSHLDKLKREEETAGHVERLRISNAEIRLLRDNELAKEYRNWQFPF